MARCFGVGRWVWAAAMASVSSWGAAAAQVSGAGSGAETREHPELEEIVVTGTRIVRRDFTAPSPISTLDQQALRSSVQPTLEEALNRMPQITPDFGRTSNNPGNGKSHINLRGLGANRTLVMLNGRRLAPAGMGNEVDVNTIPQAIVERVEIVTGGASTVYGSDAVSGVVNFITREDFEGLELEASAYVTEEGDSEVYDGNLSWGRNFADGAGNVALYGGYLERRSSFASDRAISAVPLVETFMGEIEEGGSEQIPEGLVVFPEADLGEGLVQVTFTPDGLPVAVDFPDDLYNYTSSSYLQVPLERVYGGGFANCRLSDRFEPYVEFIYTHNEGRTNLAAVPGRLGVTVNLDNPVLSPEARDIFADFYTEPGSDFAEFFFNRRFEEFGPRIMQTTNDYWRLVAGLRGSLTDVWEYDLWVTRTESDEETLLMNDVSRSRFRQGLLVDPSTGQCFDPSGGCVPVDPFGAGAISKEAMDFIGFAPYTNVASREQQLASMFIRGEPFHSWAGPVALAFGLEWRSDSGNYQADDALFTGDALGYVGSSSVVGKETVREIYAEALLPLAVGLDWAERLEMEVGGRLSDYDHAGSMETWKIGGNWAPRDALTVRAMFQRSMRAPNLVEAFEQQRTQEGAFAQPRDPDPCSASQDPQGRGFAERCIEQGIPADQIGIFEATDFYPMDILVGGNPDLHPETGETWSVGLVYSGWDSGSLSLDYFDMSIEDAIGGAHNKSVCFDVDNTEAVLCDRIRRDAVNFNVIETDARIINLGELHTEGFDFQAQYATELPAALGLGDSSADLSVDVVWTHLISLTFQANPAVQPFECAGTFGYDCATSPENRVTTFASYVSGPLDFTLVWRWLEGTDNNALDFAESVGYEDPVIAIPSVPSKHYVDLGFGYRFGEHVETRLDIANLFNTDPPLMANAVNANNTDERYYDIFGRAYRLSLYFRF